MEVPIKTLDETRKTVKLKAEDKAQELKTIFFFRNVHETSFREK